MQVRFVVVEKIFWEVAAQVSRPAEPELLARLRLGGRGHIIANAIPGERSKWLRSAQSRKSVAGSVQRACKLIAILRYHCLHAVYTGRELKYRPCGIRVNGRLNVCV
jgi:hypothetical protein